MELNKVSCEVCDGKGKILMIYGNQDFEQSKCTCPSCGGSGELDAVTVDGKTFVLVEKENYRKIIRENMDDGYSSYVTL
jgi:DnaJ-class molecular chaperone